MQVHDPAVQADPTTSIDTFMEAFKTMDADGSESLDFNEFLTGLLALGIGVDRTKAWDMFRVLDEDDSGMLSKEEFVDNIRNCVLTLRKAPRRKPSFSHGCTGFESSLRRHRKNRPPTPPSDPPFHITVRRANGIRAADVKKTGWDPDAGQLYEESSDAYCLVRWGRKGAFFEEYETIHQTSAVSESLNPVWNEECSLEVASRGEEHHVLLFELWDEDLVTKTNLRYAAMEGG